MEFPTIFDLLDRLAFLRGAPAAAVVALAAALAVVVWDIGPLRRRNGDATPIPLAPLAIPALLVVYGVGGLLLVEVLDPRLMVVYVMTGVFIAFILLPTGVQTRWGWPPAGLSAAKLARLGRPRRHDIGPLAFTDRALLRLALAAAVLLAALWLARSPGTLLSVIPAERAYLEAAIVALAGLGLVGAASSTEPLSSGVGLLLFLFGFALYYSIVDPSITMVVALVVLQLAVALVVAYLAQARYLPVDVVE